MRIPSRRMPKAVERKASACCSVLLVSALLSSSLARGDDGTTNEPVKLFPACKNSSREDFYPFEALRLHIQGRVVVEFLIDQRGKPAQVSVTESPGKALSTGALNFVRNLRCKLSDDWSQGVSNHRFRLGIYYVLVDCKLSQPCARPPNMRVTDNDIDDSMIVTAEFRTR